MGNGGRIFDDNHHQWVNTAVWLLFQTPAFENNIKKLTI